MVLRLVSRERTTRFACYAIVYEGAVADDNDNYQDALMLEFGERGYRSYSAYSLLSGKGRGNGFVWTDPAPAGEVEPLL